MTGILHIQRCLWVPLPSPAAWDVAVSMASSQGFAPCHRTPFACVQSHSLGWLPKPTLKQGDESRDACMVPATQEQLPLPTAAWPEARAGMGTNPLASPVLLPPNTWNHRETKALAKPECSVQPGCSHVPVSIGNSLEKGVSASSVPAVRGEIPYWG